ncbi:lysozyme [Methylobacterium sp. E-016]|uniref:lysozyme n=1 Tax=Methylobacterium sp. E-016 TaxID=2836556 RepID=UPI001FBB4D65|nr:lysozyme [Methylobacterium sp. E-016]MCJ2074424.1 lysozyme [Methylobacterium sp. E-016]
MSLAAIFRAFRRPAAPPIAAAHPVAPVPVVRVVAPVTPRPVISKKGRNRIAAAGVAGAVTVAAFNTIGGHEQVRLQAYIPVKGDVPTICWGETRNVRMGMSRTRAQCDEMFLNRLSEFADGIEGCVTRPMGDDLYVAFLSLAYNIGIGSPKNPGFCQSSVVRFFNAGDSRAACNAFLLYDKGGMPRRVLAGLVRRRQEKRALCRKGI